MGGLGRGLQLKWPGQGGLPGKGTARRRCWHEDL